VAPLKEIFAAERRDLDRYYRFHNRMARVIDLAGRAE
jgi:hypothetical protein